MFGSAGTFEASDSLCQQRKRSTWKGVLKISFHRTPIIPKKFSSFELQVEIQDFVLHLPAVNKQSLITPNHMAPKLRLQGSKAIWKLQPQDPVHRYHRSFQKFTLRNVAMQCLLFLYYNFSIDHVVSRLSAQFSLGWVLVRVICMQCYFMCWRWVAEYLSFVIWVHPVACFVLDWTSSLLVVKCRWYL